MLNSNKHKNMISFVLRLYNYGQIFLLLFYSIERCFIKQFVTPVRHED